MEQSNNTLHYRIAERGKLYCLEGNYKEALRHFREAILMTQRQNDPDIFFQHYSQCVMEALELAGAYDEVITYCEKFLEFLESKEEESELVNRYYATILEKMAIQYMKKEEPEQALPLLKNAQVRIGKGRQPITDEFLNWLQRGYKINKKQINETQIKNNYYIVRQNKVIPEIAVELPKAISPF